MSKVVKGIGSVFRSVGKIFSGAVKAVKKFANSKIGKMIVTAALIYFGGAAIMGAMGGASAGSGFTLSGAWTGAQAGIQSAWAGLMSGSLTKMGQAWTGAYGTGKSAVSGGATLASASGAATSAVVPSDPGTLTATMQAQFPQSSAQGLLAPPNLLSPPPPPPPGVASGMWNNAGAAGIIAGGQLLGGYMQGKGAEKEAERQQQLEAEARARYNQNVGTRLWGDQETGGYSGTHPTTRPDYQVAGGPALLQQGLIGSSMPTFNYAGFPVFNPQTNYFS